MSRSTSSAREPLTDAEIEALILENEGLANPVQPRSRSARAMRQMQAEIHRLRQLYAEPKTSVPERWRGNAEDKTR